jgi:hypothetical protein
LSHSIITRLSPLNSTSALCPHASTITSLFVRNGEVLASLTLVLATDEVRNLLVLSLLDGALVVLLALTEEVLLDVVDAYNLKCQEAALRVL